MSYVLKKHLWVGHFEVAPLEGVGPLGEAAQVEQRLRVLEACNRNCSFKKKLFFKNLIQKFQEFF